MTKGPIIGLTTLGLLAAAVFVPPQPAEAQEIPQITVRPQGSGIGGSGYVGPYGRELPGVAMFRGRAVPVSPDFWAGEVRIPSRQKVPQEYTYQDPLPVLDGWHGTLGPGFPF